MDLKEAILKIPKLVEKLGMAEDKPAETPQNGAESKEDTNGDGVVDAADEVANTEQSFLDAKLSDGTIVSWEGDLMQGTPIFVMDETGNRLPAPDGVLELEDGTILEVVGGAVAAIKPAAEVQEPGNGEEGMADDEAGLTPAQAKRLIETVVKETVFDKAELEAKFEAIEKDNEALKAELEDSKKLLTETFAIVEKLADMPSVAPKTSKDGFMIAKAPKSSREEIEEFRKRNNIT